MNYQDFVEKTIAFVSAGAKVSADQINDTTQLVGSGIVDSLLLTELILHVEDVLDCVIDVENFRISTFETMNSIYAAYGK